MAIQLVENTVVAERYRLTRMIGRGGMGTVWQATNLRLDVPCAIKFIEGKLAEDAVALARFEREAKAAAQLRSAHVVQILDHGTFHGTPYIAMELLEGEDLGKRLSRTLKMAPRDVAAVVTHVSRALSKAHGMEIVHRDLKPENIFLAWDDDREVVKVLDFGIAKRVQIDMPSHTTVGHLLGTPAYMSPEQAQGARDVDYRSDLWALAVIAFRCMTGVLPFRSKSLAELLLQIIVRPLPVPSQLTDVPPGFDAWWERAASRDANRRFQSARELAQALVDALGVLPFSDGLERRVRDPVPLPDLPLAAPAVRPPPAPIVPNRVVLVSPIASSLILQHPPGATATGSSFSAVTGSALATTFAGGGADSPSGDVLMSGERGASGWKGASGSTLVATGIALIAIGAIATAMLSRAKDSSASAAAAAARAAGEPVVPEVMDEAELVPAAAARPSSAPSGGDRAALRVDSPTVAAAPDHSAPANGHDRNERRALTP